MKTATREGRRLHRHLPEPAWGAPDPKAHVIHNRQIVIAMHADMLARVEAFRLGTRGPSKAEALRKLIARGLEQHGF